METRAQRRKKVKEEERQGKEINCNVNNEICPDDNNSGDLVTLATASNSFSFQEDNNNGPTSSSAIDNEDDDESDVFETTAMAKALGNPLILEVIFKTLVDKAEVDAVRLVSRTWNYLVTPLFRHRQRLTYFGTSSSDSHGKTLNSISLLPFDSFTTLWNPLVEGFLKKHGASLSSLQFNRKCPDLFTKNKDDLSPAINNILTKWAPNLESLAFDGNMRTKFNKKTPLLKLKSLSAPLCLPTKAKEGPVKLLKLALKSGTLTSFSFDVRLSHTLHDLGVTCLCFHNLIEALQMPESQSGVLTHLGILGTNPRVSFAPGQNPEDQCLNLSPLVSLLPNLTSLHVECDQGETEETEDFRVADILEKFPSLQKLRIKIRQIVSILDFHLMDECVFFITRVQKTVPGLTELWLDIEHKYAKTASPVLHGLWFLLSLPNLKKLTIAGRSRLLGYLLGAHTPREHGALEVLHLAGPKDPALLWPLVTFFPNLKTLWISTIPEKVEEMEAGMKRRFEHNPSLLKNSKVWAWRYWMEDLKEI